MRIFLCMFVLIALRLNGQFYQCSPGQESWSDHYLVIADQGVALRAAKGEGSALIATIPNNALLQICEEFTGDSIVVGGKKGYWTKAFYNAQTGYVFTGFLVKVFDKTDFRFVDTSPSFVYRMDSLELDSSREYWSFFQNEESDYHELDFRIEKCELKNFRKIVYETGVSVEIGTPQQSARPLFIFTGITPPIKDRVPGKWINRILFPGEMQVLNITNFKDREQSMSAMLYAKGAIEETENMEWVAFRGIKDYELRIRTRLNNKLIDQLIFKMDMNSWDSGGYEGAVFIKWAGDINGDYKLDLIIGYTAHYAGGKYALFLSDSRNDNLFEQYKDVGSFAYD